LNGNQMFAKNGFNLYPKDIKKQHNIKAIIYYSLIGLFIFNLCFGFYTSSLYGKINDINTQRLENIRKIEEAKPRVQVSNNIKGYKADVDKISAYEKSIKSLEPPAFEILRELESKSPSNITLNSVTMAQGGAITLVGMAIDEFVACDFVTILKKMDKFSNVYLKSVSKKEDDVNKTGDYVNIFNIDCQVKGMEKKATASTAAATQQTKATDGGKK